MSHRSKIRLQKLKRYKIEHILFQKARSNDETSCYCPRRKVIQEQRVKDK